MQALYQAQHMSRRNVFLGAPELSTALLLLLLPFSLSFPLLTIPTSYAVELSLTRHSTRPPDRTSSGMGRISPPSSPCIDVTRSHFPNGDKPIEPVLVAWLNLAEPCILLSRNRLHPLAGSTRARPWSCRPPSFPPSSLTPSLRFCSPQQSLRIKAPRGTRATCTPSRTPCRSYTSSLTRDARGNRALCRTHAAHAASHSRA